MVGYEKLALSLFAQMSGSQWVEFFRDYNRPRGELKEGARLLKMQGMS